MQTTKPNETKLALVQVTFYVIQPGNELGLFYTGPRTHTGRSYFLVKTMIWSSKKWKSHENTSLWFQIY